MKKILAPFKFLGNFARLMRFWLFGHALLRRKVRQKPKKTFLLYLRYALTNPNSETTFANRHGGVRRVKVVSESL